MYGVFFSCVGFWFGVLVCAGLFLWFGNERRGFVAGTIASAQVKDLM